MRTAHIICKRADHFYPFTTDNEENHGLSSHQVSNLTNGMKTSIKSQATKWS